MSIAEGLQLGARFPLTVKKTTDRGRCLVALTPIPNGATIEIAPVQVLPATMAVVINAYRLDYFIFWESPTEGNTLALPLGLLGLCNHSDRPTAKLVPNSEKRLVHLIALRDLGSGDEITLRYRDPSRSYLRDIQ